MDGVLGRAAGAERIQTAVQLSRSAFQPGVPAAVLVRADSFADALSAGPAAARLGGPILLAGDDLPAETAAELDRLDPDRIIAVGGTAAIGEAALEAAAAFTDGTVERLAGPDRIATSAAVADAVFDADDPVFLATGGDFPDALGGGVLAARQGGPLLLVGDAAPPALADRTPERAVLLGGTAVLPASLEAEVAEMTGADVTRIAGTDRFDTAARIARAAYPEGSDVVVLATGGGFADALAGVPVAALAGAPLLLTEVEALPAATEAWLRESRPQALLLGGEQAISPAVEALLAELLGDGA